MFEICLIERDSLGREVLKPNGLPKKKNFESNNAYEIWKFYVRNSSTTNSRNKSNVNNNPQEGIGTS